MTEKASFDRAKASEHFDSDYIQCVERIAQELRDLAERITDLTEMRRPHGCFVQYGENAAQIVQAVCNAMPNLGLGQLIRRANDAQRFFDES